MTTHLILATLLSRDMLLFLPDGLLLLCLGACLSTSWSPSSSLLSDKVSMSMFSSDLLELFSSYRYIVIGRGHKTMLMLPAAGPCLQPAALFSSSSPPGPHPHWSLCHWSPWCSGWMPCKTPCPHSQWSASHLWSPHSQSLQTLCCHFHSQLPEKRIYCCYFYWGLQFDITFLIFFISMSVGVEQVEESSSVSSVSVISWLFWTGEACFCTLGGEITVSFVGVCTERSGRLVNLPGKDSLLGSGVLTWE